MIKHNSKSQQQQQKDNGRSGFYLFKVLYVDNNYVNKSCGLIMSDQRH
jgi:hypothetical protein